jgi:hypothetical protein
MWTYIIALSSFVSEVFIYKTAPIESPGVFPVLIISRKCQVAFWQKFMGLFDTLKPPAAHDNTPGLLTCHETINFSVFFVMDAHQLQQLHEPETQGRFQKVKVECDRSFF